MDWHATIDARAALSHLADLGARLDAPQPFLLRWGQRVAITARNAARGKGGRRFWNDVARSVRVNAVSATAVTVGSNHVAAAQKQFGGEIRPVNAAARTIPIADEAEGKRAGEFALGGRRLFVLDRDAGDTVGILGYSDNDRFHPLFVLRRRVVQRPDPWFPEGREVERLGIAEAELWAREATA